MIGTTGYPDWTKLPNFSRIGQDKVSSLIGRGNLPLSLRETGLWGAALDPARPPSHTGLQQSFLGPHWVTVPLGRRDLAVDLIGSAQVAPAVPLDRL